MISSPRPRQARRRPRAGASAVRFPVALVWFPLVHRSLPALKAAGSAFFRYYPPMWFTGTFQRSLDSVTPFSMRRAAWVCSPSSCCFSVPSRLARQPQEVHPRDGHGAGSAAAPSLLSGGRRLLAAVFLRHPVQRAVYSFFMQTLRRSREHKLKLTLFLALPVSYLLSQFVVVYFKKGPSGRALDSLLISMPLALHFFLVIGMRLTAAYPHTLPASFIFRSSESLPLRNYMNG